MDAGGIGDSEMNEGGRRVCACDADRHRDHNSGIINTHQVIIPSLFNHYPTLTSYKAIPPSRVIPPSIS